MEMSNEELVIIKSLVGETITSDNLEFIDCFIYKDLSIFIPVGGSCGYAVTPKHKHPSYMFIIPYDEQTQIYVNNKKLTPKVNNIFCLSPNILHHEVQNYLPPKYCAIFIKKEVFENSYLLYDESINFDNMLVKIKTDKLELLIQDFINESNNLHFTKDIVLKYLSVLLIHEIIRNITKYKMLEIKTTNNTILNKAITFMDRNFEHNITIEDLSKITNLSKNYFISYFKKEMNLSPMQYLNNIRLENAKKMLRANKLSITTISAQCGFNSPSYFAKIFKNRFHISPKDYIK